VNSTNLKLYFKQVKLAGCATALGNVHFASVSSQPNSLFLDIVEGGATLPARYVACREDLFDLMAILLLVSLTISIPFWCVDVGL
jgi:hypothetical protein